MLHQQRSFFRLAQRTSKRLRPVVHLGLQVCPQLDHDILSLRPRQKITRKPHISIQHGRSLRRFSFHAVSSSTTLFSAWFNSFHSPSSRSSIALPRSESL